MKKFNVFLALVGFLISQIGFSHGVPYKAPKIPHVFIETDIGHDADDIVALVKALALHKEGNIKVIGISVVSQNNQKRAELVSYLLSEAGVRIPIFVTPREESYASGEEEEEEEKVPLNKVVKLWDYKESSDGRSYDHKPHATFKKAQQTQQRRILKRDYRFFYQDIHHAKSSTQEKKALLQRMTQLKEEVSVCVIGPGVDVESYKNNCDGSLFPCIRHVFFQGNYCDEASFNMGSDMESYQEFQELIAESKTAKQFYLGKNLAYLTKVSMNHVRLLESSLCAPLCMWLQLGVMEFRESNKNLFNKLNFSGRLEADGASKDPVLNCPSLQKHWFEALKVTTPMYDLTTFLLAESMTFTSEEEPEHPFYKILKRADRVYTIGEVKSGLKLETSEGYSA